MYAPVDKEKERGFWAIKERRKRREKLKRRKERGKRERETEKWAPRDPM